MVTLENGRLSVEGKPIDLWSGAFHYWRHPPDRWGFFFERIAQMGFRIVETYVPWSVHERKPNEFEFGETDPQFDLNAWIEAAQQHGFQVLLRPGPHINSELTFFGFPERLWKDPDLWSRDPRGNPILLPAPPRMFPVLSYANPKLLDLYQPFLERVAEIVRPRIPPGGPVIGFQSDNENSFFFRTGAYDQDYSRAAVNFYRAWLRKRYGGALPRGYPEIPVADMLPPTRFHPGADYATAYFTDWVRCKEDILIESHRDLRRRWHDAGIGNEVFWFHNYPPMDPALPPFDVSGMEREVVDIQGIDLYQLKEDTVGLVSWLSYLAGTSRLPFVAEFGAGTTLWIKPLQLEDQAYVYPLALALGIRAANFYMLIDRDRWYGAPLSRTGRPMETFALFQDFLALVAETRAAEAHPEVDVTLLIPRDTLRLEHAANLFSVVTPLLYEFAGLEHSEMTAEDQLGFARAPQIVFRETLKRNTEVLAQLGIPYHMADTTSVPTLLGKTVIVVAGEAMSEKDQAAIAKLLEGGKKVLLVPTLPVQTLEGEPCRILADAKGELHVVADLRAVVSLMPPPPMRVTLPAFCRVHRSPAGRFLYVVNPTASAVAPEITGGAPGERMWGAGTPEILPPYSVTVWRLP